MLTLKLTRATELPVYTLGISEAGLSVKYGMKESIWLDGGATEVPPFFYVHSIRKTLTTAGL